MKKYKNKITAAVIIAAILVIAYFASGNIKTGEQPSDNPIKSETQLPNEKVPDEKYDEKNTVNETDENSKSDNSANDEKQETPKNGNAEYSENQGMKIGEDGKDQYKTEPVPEGKPVPAEPQNTEITDEQHTCTISVRCDSILGNMAKLDPEKVKLIPQDGVILSERTAVFYEGESVFNVLKREMKKNKIHMEFVNTPVYNSAYIEGIANIYEFDCGELSGWMYKVNGWFPNYGCSRYMLKDGDRVEWVYTCDLGADVGGYSASGGGQKDE